MAIIKNAINAAKRAVGYGQLKDFTFYVYNGAKSMLAETDSSARPDTTQSIQNLGLSAEHLQKIKRTFTILLRLYLGLAALAVIYAIYKLLIGDYLSTIVSFSVMLVCLALAFRYHFWLFQLQRGKLGCTWREWLNDLLAKGNK